MALGREVAFYTDLNLFIGEFNPATYSSANVNGITIVFRDTLYSACLSEIVPALATEIWDTFDCRPTFRTASPHHLGPLRSGNRN